MLIYYKLISQDTKQIINVNKFAVSKVGKEVIICISKGQWFY